MLFTRSALPAMCASSPAGSIRRRGVAGRERGSACGLPLAPEVTRAARIPADVRGTKRTSPGRNASPSSNPTSMPRILRILPLFLLASVTPLAAQGGAPAARTDRALTARLERLTQGFHGEVGVYVRTLRRGASVAIRADELYPTASMIKVPILLTLYDQVEHGRLNLDARVPYPDTLHYRYGESTDVVGYMAAGAPLPLSELAFLMPTVSDNFASLWIQG